MADYTLLDLIPEFSHLEHPAGDSHGWNDVFSTHPLFNPSGHITMTHVVFSSVVVVLILIVGLMIRGKWVSKDPKDTIPEGKFTLRNAVEVIFDAVFNTMEGMMGRDMARKFFPLIATLAVYILISNLMGLVPGLAPPTQNFNTNLAMSVVVFVFYNFVGFQEQGLNYAKHFLGPMMLIAPLIFVIEIFSHAFRPISLSVRLTGNLVGDHAMLGVFAGIAGDFLGGFPLLLTVPFMFLGLLVSVVQTVIFCMLTAIYIAMAVEHHDDHH